MLDRLNSFFYVIVWKCGSVKKKATASSRRSGFLKFKVEGTSNPHNSCCKYYKEDGGATFVKWRYIFLWWVLYDLYDTICLEYGIMYYPCAPSVAILDAVAEDGITLFQFANKYAIVNNYCVH